MGYTIAINIVNAGSIDAITGHASDAGHMYITLSDGATSVSYGFYGGNPDSPEYTATAGSTGYVVTTDSVRYPSPSSSSSQSFVLSGTQYEAVKSWAEAARTQRSYLGTPIGVGGYDVLSNSCIDFAWLALRTSGIPGPLGDGALIPQWNSALLRNIYFDWYRRPEFNREGMNYHKISPTVPTLFATTNALRPNAPTAPRRDPLSFDLDNDGLETVGINPAAPILFDHTGSGVKTATGWLKGDDAFLALDRNGNGTIDNGTELFGDSTRLPDGTLARDGFAALAAQDTNADGLVNTADVGFANLRLWRDLNQNGISEANELQTLTTAGIASITVAKTEHSVLLPNGNQLADLGSYTRSNGTTGELGETAKLADIDLASNPFFSEFTDTIPLTTQTQSLPDMQGSGLVRGLREAANDAVRGSGCSSKSRCWRDGGYSGVTAQSLRVMK